MAKDSTPPRNENRSAPISEAFRAFIQTGWAQPAPVSARPWPVSRNAAGRRDEISAQFPGVTLIVPAGSPKQRSNDTDYPFRPHSAFTYLTGWGHSATPGSIAIAIPTATGHEWELVMRGPAPRTSDEFYANAAIGEFWTGRRPTLEDVGTWLGLNTREREGFELPALTGPGAIIREADPVLTAECDAVRGFTSPPALDADLERVASEMRLIKDDYEVSELRAAIASTHAGFNDIVEVLPRSIGHARGERIVEGAFHSRARLEGNSVGYDSIVASGSHACILHWVTNDGPISPGDLLLVDAGVERDSLYTADITRTIPVSGTFTPHQREVYEAVLEAADVAFAMVKPGVSFHEIHDAAMAVIATRVSDWGFLPVSLTKSLKKTSQLHRRFMIHGTSHHLGLDVHDCAHARKERYLQGTLAAGMVFTIEPGLYFQPDDETVPPEWRGIGVRIEDNILVTATGAENLSAAIPRSVAAVEDWMAG